MGGFAMTDMNPQEKGREEAQRTAEQMRRQSSELSEQARQRGRRIVDEQKHAAAGQLTAFANALHKAADELDREGHASAGQYAHWSADRLDSIAHGLDEQEPRSLFHQAEQFAREQPAMFIGGAVAAGLALAWALKPPGTGISAEQVTSRLGKSDAPRRTSGEAHLTPRAEAEYGELATRKPGSPPREHH
jgi:hypothetical protein